MPTIALVQLCVTTLGFLFVTIQLYFEYRWRHRQYAVNMVAEWNDHTNRYRRSIDEAIPGLLDQLHVGLEPEEAERVYSSDGKDKVRFKLKNDLIELLNYCEF